jgi:hypothetical protein
MAFRLAAISLRQVLRLLLFRCRSSRAKDLELLVLRQELEVLHRQVPRPRFRSEERWVLTVLQRLRPVRNRLSSLVTPDTIRRWHRELVRSKWHYRHRVVSRGRIPDHVRLFVWRLASENPTWGYCRSSHRRSSKRGSVAPQGRSACSECSGVALRTPSERSSAGLRTIDSDVAPYRSANDGILYHVHHIVGGLCHPSCRQVGCRSTRPRRSGELKAIGLRPHDTGWVGHPSGATGG